jgi:hypothetical protein
MKVVANVGADWWRDATAGYVHGFSNNPGAGMSNWVELSTRWITFRFASWSTSRLPGGPASTARRNRVHVRPGPPTPNQHSTALHIQVVTDQVEALRFCNCFRT